MTSSLAGGQRRPPASLPLGVPTTGALLGPLVATALVALAAGFDTVFVALAMVGLLVLIFFVPVPTSVPPRRERVAFREVWNTLTAPGPRRACLAAALLGVVTVGDMVLYVAVQQRAGLPTAVLPLLPLGTAVTFLIGRSGSARRPPRGCPARCRPRRARRRNRVGLLRERRPWLRGCGSWPG